VHVATDLHRPSLSAALIIGWVEGRSLCWAAQLGSLMLGHPTSQYTAAAPSAPARRHSEPLRRPEARGRKQAASSAGARNARPPNRSSGSVRNKSRAGNGASDDTASCESAASRESAPSFGSELRVRSESSSRGQRGRRALAVRVCSGDGGRRRGRCNRRRRARLA
jgi:hypothetical protein